MTTGVYHGCPESVRSHSTARTRLFLVSFAALLLCGLSSIPTQAQRTQFQGSPTQAVNLRPISRLSNARNLQLTIGLPLRNKQALTDFLNRLYDPTSLVYCQYLTPEQFTEGFGPTEQDYQAVIEFLTQRGFKVTQKHSNRMLLGVTASVADVEKTFHVQMGLYRHPKENRMFYAPNTPPAID